MRSACEKFEATPTFAENHAHFRAFLREATCPTCRSIRFRLRSLLHVSHAEVSHRGKFLSSYPRQGVPSSLSPVLLCTKSSPKGGSMEPQEPPLNPPLQLTMYSLCLCMSCSAYLLIFMAYEGSTEALNFHYFTT